MDIESQETKSSQRWLLGVFLLVFMVGVMPIFAAIGVLIARAALSGGVAPIYEPWP